LLELLERKTQKDRQLICVGAKKGAPNHLDHLLRLTLLANPEVFFGG
jgi:hypothetical protein